MDIRKVPIGANPPHEINVLIEVGRMPVQSGAVPPARPIGAPELEDEAGGDEKILAAPLPRITLIYDKVTPGAICPRPISGASGTSSSPIRIWSPRSGPRVGSWREPDEAHRLIRERHRAGRAGMMPAGAERPSAEGRPCR